MKNITLFFIIVLMLVSFTTMAYPQDNNPQITDDFTLTYHDTSYGFSIEYLEDSYAPITDYGGRFNMVGNTAGPFEYTGVPITVLADEFPDLTGKFTMVTISSDGYVFHYTHDDITGDVTVYDEEGTIVQTDGMTMILAYMEDGIKDFYGGPLRIAFIGKDGLFTDSFLWSKDIIGIEFLDESSDTKAPTIHLDSPVDAIYLFNKKLIPYTEPLIIGDITIQSSITDTNDIAQVIFTIESNDAPAQIKIIRDPPYKWDYTDKAFGKYMIIITAYDFAGNLDSLEKNVFIINPF